MPDRGSLAEVGKANTQLAALHTSPTEPPHDTFMQQSYEALMVLSTSCSKISDQKLLEQSGKAILQTLKACQEGRPTIGPKVLSNRFYTAGFKALNSILATLRSQHGLSTAELVELLRHFFTYGVELSLGSAAVPAAAAFGHGSVRNSASAGRVRYQPPHARRRSSSSSAGWSDSSSTGSQSSSESDTGSDTDSSSRGGGRDTASAVRLAALACLQQLAKADGRALHPFWIMLLPVYNPLQTKYHDATLMDAIVRDPVPKVRAIAAAVLSSMLEGPAQKAYMIIAEATSSARPPVRGFTTLSSTLGHLVIALHDGLLHAISNEPHMAALVNMLKTLATLMLSAAYNRLPTDLLPRCIEVLSRRLLSAPHKLVATSADIQAVQTAACACLAAAFCTKAAFPPVATLLCAPSLQPPGLAPTGQTSLITTLLELSCSDLPCLPKGCSTSHQCCIAAAAESAILRCEALSALHGVAKNYIAALALGWDAISHAVELSVQAERLTGNGSAPALPRSVNAAVEGTPTVEAKCAQQAIKLLSEFLTGCYRLTQANAQNQSSGHPSDLPLPGPAPTMASSAMGKGSSATGASAAVGTSLLSYQTSASPAPSSMPSEPCSPQRQADLANTNSPATTSLTDSCRINATHQVQRQMHGTEAVVSNCPPEQMSTTSQGSNPSGSRREEALQTAKVAKGVQLATPPITPKDDLSSPAGDDAHGAQCLEMWRQSCSCLWPQAVCHDSPLVRSAAQAGLSQMPYPVYQALESSWQAQICNWSWHICQSDSVAAVRAAATKCVGQTAEGMPVQNCPSELMKSIDVLCSAVQDSTLSVRVSAASALANLADALQQQQQELNMQMMPSLTSLAAAAITACRDGDKVQVNAVRGLGNLFSIQCPPSGQHRQAQLEDTQLLSSSRQQAAAGAATANLQCRNTREGDAFSCGQVQCSCGQVQCSCGVASCSNSGHTYWWGEDWMSQGIQCLLLSLGSSTDKVQWNACYAIGRLFINSDAAHSAERSGQLSTLLSALLTVIRTNGSFKIQNHATTALSNLGQRCLYGELWQPTVQTIADAFISLQKSENDDDRSINAGKNYQFKDALQQHLRQCMARLMEIANPEDMTSRAFAQTQINWLDLELLLSLKG